MILGPKALEKSEGKASDVRDPFKLQCNKIENGYNSCIGRTSLFKCELFIENRLF